MANMAMDSWLPHRLAALSERLTMHNGVYLMGSAAIAVLLLTGGDIHDLVLMYSINVFVTFSLSNLGMCRLWWRRRSGGGAGAQAWRRKLAVHGLALSLCFMILAITTYEKFSDGGWKTLAATAVIVALCLLVRRHYRMVGRCVQRLEADLDARLAHRPANGATAAREVDPSQPTAVLLAGGYSSLGIRTLLEIDRIFPGQYAQVVFLSVGVIDSGTFKGADEVARLRDELGAGLERYASFARERLGWAADTDMAIGTEAVSEIERLCREVFLRFPRSVFFAGNLIFREPRWWHRVLHNETAHAVQRRLEFDRLPMVVVPVRVLQ